MLTRPLRLASALTALAVAAATVVAVVVMAAAEPARADAVYCPPLGGPCYVVATDPGRPGRYSGPGAGGDAEVRTCRWAGQTVPCWYATRDGTGWFNPADGCYYFRMSPQPPAGSPLWQGHQPGDGAVYALLCYPPDRAERVGFAGVGFAWLPRPPPGFGGPTAAQLAAQAINQLPIRGPDIGIAPQTNGAGLVGLPVWLWTSVSPQTWGPLSATASVPGLSVTATARATRIVWQLGDGHTVTCANPGTPYKKEYGRTPSPTCGYPEGYESPSAPRYTVVATTTWHVTWAGGGERGALDVTRASTASIDIDELSVVTS